MARHFRVLRAVYVSYSLPPDAEIKTPQRKEIAVMSLNSSNLSWAEHDGGSTLTVGFRNGSVYEYYNCPYSRYTGLCNASSHGRYHHAYIRNSYPYRRIR